MSGPGEAVEGVAPREHLKCFIQFGKKKKTVANIHLTGFFFLQKVCGLYKTEIMD